WTPWEQAVFKLLYGTAYRTPYVKQLLAETLAEPEKVENIGLQASWKPAPELTLTGGLFHNDIDNHILQDKYAGAGLSLPNQQDIWGVELEGRWQMLPELELRADLTLLDHSGPPESYLYNDYSLINPDGSLDKHYTRIDYNYDPGAKNLFNLSTLWTPGDDISLSLDFRYHSSTHLYYTPEEKTVDYPGVWLTDLSCELQDLITPGLDLTVFINNLLDENYQIPGRYSTLKGQGLEAGFILRKEF
ncbi:MAG: TonB-dependent receptor, partial [Desulfobia sp.]